MISSTRVTRIRARLRRLTGPVRNRLTVLATVLVLLALLVAGGVMVLVARNLLYGTADSAASARAHEIASMVQTEGVGGIDKATLNLNQYIDIVQIYQRDGAPLISTFHGTTRPLGPFVSPGTEQVIDDTAPAPDAPEFRTTLLGAVTPDHGPVTIAVGTSEGPLHWLLAVVALLCGLMFPIIVVLIGVLTYYFVGRSLEPVEAIRRRVDEISVGDLHQRVPVPATRDEIATLAVTMNQMLDRLQEARARELRFVGDASHELNSPLTTLVGLFDLAEMRGEGIDRETAREVMAPEARRLQYMVADMLLLARADESGIPLRLGPVDLDDVVESEIRRLTAVRELAVGELTISATVLPIQVTGDEEKLSRAVRNLADNAIRHARTRIAIEMVADDDTTVTVTVVDDGPGVSDEDKERILDRFVRLDSARTRTFGGAGLGLAIVSEIVRAHGGEMIIDDAPGGGARIGFTLPQRPVQ
ncbi:sensor histidine kinase [Gordonia sp. (in: high G+C Gram-positive bacteria)]|uniref:sensor histidine kinase n=1 Tax=Gordonia sp. (in: high G+C Gram-positive bacteria) TaxID=84139 RepID=UPI003C75D140